MGACLCGGMGVKERGGGGGDNASDRVVVKGWNCTATHNTPAEGQKR